MTHIEILSDTEIIEISDTEIIEISDTETRATTRGNGLKRYRRAVVSCIRNREPTLFEEWIFDNGRCVHNQRICKECFDILYESENFIDYMFV